jgi:hypothetical protein
MSTRTYHCFATAFLVGLLLICCGVLQADPVPGPNECSDLCQEKKEFIFHTTLKCTKFDEGDCVRCVGGLCPDISGGPAPPCKALPPPDRVWVEVYPAGSCTPLCDLQVGKYSEATVPEGTRESRDQVTWHKCIP